MLRFRLLTATAGLGLLVAALAPAAVLAPAPAGAAGDAHATYNSFSGGQLSRGRMSDAVVDGDAVRATGAGARWTSPWVTPGHTFTEVIPSWTARTPGKSWIGVQVRAITSTGKVSSFDLVGKWAKKEDAIERSSGSTQSDDVARVSTDTLVAAPGTEFISWKVRVVMHHAAGGPSPKLSKVGAVASHRASGAAATSAAVSGAVQLPVPAYSQMTHRGQYPQYGGGGEAWCSPTSLAMVLAYYQRLPGPKSYSWVKPGYADPWVDAVARSTFDHRYDGTGNWGFNTAYAATRTGDAFVTRLGDLRDAERLVHAGIPVIASIAFGKGQLGGAPISASNGHLVVISGFTSTGDVIVNDPAAPSNATVVRTYNRGQFEQAWQGRSGGTVYVVRDAAHPLPATTGAW